MPSSELVKHELLSPLSARRKVITRHRNEENMDGKSDLEWVEQ